MVVAGDRAGQPHGLPGTEAPAGLSKDIQKLCEEEYKKATEDPPKKPEWVQSVGSDKWRVQARQLVKCSCTCIVSATTCICNAATTDPGLPLSASVRVDMSSKWTVSPCAGDAGRPGVEIQAVGLHNLQFQMLGECTHAQHFVVRTQTGQLR